MQKKEKKRKRIYSITLGEILVSHSSMWFFEYFRFWLRTYVGQTEADFVQDDHRKWNVQHFTQIAQHIAFGRIV